MEDQLQQLRHCFNSSSNYHYLNPLLSQIQNCKRQFDYHSSMKKLVQLKKTIKYNNVQQQDDDQCSQQNSNDCVYICALICSEIGCLSQELSLNNEAIKYFIKSQNYFFEIMKQTGNLSYLVGQSQQSNK